MASVGPNGAVVLLSGRVGAGKTTLGEALVTSHGFKRLFTRDAILLRLPDTPRTRVDLQAAGERLDRETGGRWVADELRELLAAGARHIVVDSVLIREQIDAVRTASELPLIHVHLTAPAQTLESRYANKLSGIQEASRYSELLGSSTEAHVDELSEVADLVIDTSVTPIDAELDQVVACLSHDGVEIEPHS